MFEFQVKIEDKGQGLIRIDTDDPEIQLPFEVVGDEQFAAVFLDWIANTQGPFGHYLSAEAVRANDLEFALTQDSKITHSLGYGELSQYPTPDRNKVF